MYDTFFLFIFLFFFHSKESAKLEVDDGVVTDLEEKNQSKFGIEDGKCFEEVQRLIDGKCFEIIFQEDTSYVGLFLPLNVLEIFILASTSLSR